MPTNMGYPILANDGRTVLGYARTVAGARRWIAKNVHVPRGMALSVWLRPEFIAEINGGPVGWMYSISYDAGA